MSKKLPISVCLLVLNEADRLGRTLRPLADFAEVVVLDSGSTDGSQELCRDSGCMVHEAAWEGFGKMRNRLFRLGSKPWVLWLDADEVVTPELLEELRRMFEGGEELQDAYAINRMVNFCGKWVRHGDWFPDWNVRLFRAGVWEMEPREVHEGVKITGTVGRLEGLLEHHTYRDWEDQRKRSERYARLWAEEAAKSGKRAGWLSGPLHAVWKFLRGYFLKLGILDGVLGLRVAWVNAREVWWKYGLLQRLALKNLHQKAREPGREG